ncbi:PREDICTED: butyrophilin subfamily 1 member A1-like [Calidris pugnax]|uniref:butyrophilin subfamily 1 member A1-like n=1 Tax=Calidris pugnax TaxID=198806 RepID=UPI00071D1FAD|nr:PREDICTED: butyrophilin subfamily 1 member A1-like [Calidris pugnax]
MYGEQMEEYAGRTELSRDGLSSGSLDLRISELRPSDDGQYVCTVRDAASYGEAVVQLKVAVPFFHIVHPRMAALMVLFLLLVMCFGVMAYVYRRQVVQSRALEERDAALEEQGALLGKRAAALDMVTLDPNTAHSELVLSEDLRSVKCGTTWQNLPNTPERFKDLRCVLGRERFQEGRHCWEVEVEEVVGGDSWWGVGVAKESVERKGRVLPSPGDGVWAVWHWEGQFEALTSPPTPLSLSPVPRRIWVCLDCRQGLVTFLNADTGVEIFTFPPSSFHGETLCPWFLLETEETQLCLRGSTL